MAVFHREGSLIRTEDVLVVVACCECGILFGLPKAFNAQLRRNGHNFYCPNGHAQVYRETEADRLRKQLEAEQRRAKNAVEWAESEVAYRRQIERSRSALKGQLTKTKKRIARGICPCCNQPFDELAAHMQQEHPEYVDEAAREFVSDTAVVEDPDSKEEPEKEPEADAGL